MSQIRKISIYTVISATAAVLSGCIVAPAPYYQGRVAVVQPGGASVEYVQTAPPAVQNEVITVSPGVGYIWTPGIWYWSGGRHVWRGGSWTRPPVGYSTWNNGGWTHVPGRGWQSTPGYWR